MSRIHIKDVWIEVKGKKYYGANYSKNNPVRVITTTDSVNVTFGVIVSCPSPPCPSSQNRVRWWIDKVNNGSDHLYYDEVMVGTELKEISIRIGSRTLNIGKYRFGAASYEPPDYNTSETPKYIYFEIRRPNPEDCPCDVVRQIFSGPDEKITVLHLLKAINLGYRDCADYISLQVGKTAGEVFPECFQTTPPSPPGEMPKIPWEYVALGAGIAVLASTALLWGFQHR